MPWMVRDAVTERREFVLLARVEGANVRELCRRFGVSPVIAYKWLDRYARHGEGGLVDRPRRPYTSPSRTPTDMEEAVLALRDTHRAWGGRKLRRRLQDLGAQTVPAASTITEILRRNGRLDNNLSSGQKAFQRFEHPAPNDLWQMDFKGHFAMEQGRCHPLTVLDDHSRYSLGLRACDNERTATVQGHLTQLFTRYGLPRRMLMDNGSPWGDDGAHPYTPLTVWLLRLGVRISHGRPYHPQTQGKEERFHRTLKAEVLRWEQFNDLASCQARFDAWREVYNHERPHEALSMAVPASRYEASPRSFPGTLPTIDYGPDEIVRKVGDKGFINYKGYKLKVPKAFKGYPVALRATVTDGVFDVMFCWHKIAHVDIRDERTT